MSKIKAVGFDYGGVIKGAPSFLFVKKVCELLGISEDEFHEAYYTHNKKFNRNEVDRPGLWKLVLEDLNKSEFHEQVVNLNNETFNQGLNTEILDLSDKLRENGYKTALLSNNSLDGAELIRSEGVDKHFDLMHVSAETGHVKPEPKAFENLAKDLGVAPDEMVYIDDSPKSLSSSNEVGYTPLLYIGYQDLLEKLSKLEISVG